MACASCAKRRQAMQQAQTTRRAGPQRSVSKVPVATAAKPAVVKNNTLANAFKARRQRMRQITKSRV